MEDKKKNRDWMAMWARKPDFATLEPLSHAAMGDPVPLADHIEAEGYICPATRAFIADYLRGDVVKKKGNRRTFAQKKMELKALEKLFPYKLAYQMNTGKKCSDNKALELYDELYCIVGGIGMIPTETMRTYLRKSKSRSRK